MIQLKSPVSDSWFLPGFSSWFCVFFFTFVPNSVYIILFYFYLFIIFFAHLVD